MYVRILACTLSLGLIAIAAFQYGSRNDLILQRRRLECRWLSWQHKSVCQDEATATTSGVGTNPAWAGGDINSKPALLAGIHNSNRRHASGPGFGHHDTNSHGAAEAAFQASLSLGRTSSPRSYASNVDIGAASTTAPVADTLPIEAWQSTTTSLPVPVSAGWLPVEELFAAPQPKPAQLKV